MIDFNRPYITGDEEKYIIDAVRNKKISGNGKYTQLCQKYFETNLNANKALLTTSCTDALEMAAILCEIEKGDEVIVPSYTFVSSALAFVREGAKIVFADSLPDHPNIDTSKIESLITSKTKAIVVVHYGGLAVDMDEIMHISQKYNLLIIEDAAQAIDSTYNGVPLGTIGHFGAFSFHETKNIQCGEGGLLLVNDSKYKKRAEIIWEKGTNRAEFFRGEVNKYQWVDTGSSFLPSEITAAYLYAQLMHLDTIQQKRKKLWNRYLERLLPLSNSGLVHVLRNDKPDENNAHVFYLLTNSIDERSSLIQFLKDSSIHAVFHYLALHKSSYYSDKHDGRELPNAVQFENRLLRLPLYFELSLDEVDMVCDRINSFYNS